LWVKFPGLTEKSKQFAGVFSFYPEIFYPGVNRKKTLNFLVLQEISDIFLALEISPK